MKAKSVVRNQKGFTLIEIIAVLVILGILAAVAIPKYLDMRTDAVRSAASGAVAELNARERLGLAQWKLQEKDGIYDLATLTPPMDRNLGNDWCNKDFVSPSTCVFKGKVVTFTVTIPATTNTPATWVSNVAD
jgi:prepilin-type N-terminal cleavage/methylation domain-containing protein